MKAIIGAFEGRPCLLESFSFFFYCSKLSIIPAFQVLVANNAPHSESVRARLFSQFA